MILTCCEDRRKENQHVLWHYGNSTHTLLQLCIMLHLSVVCMFLESVQEYINSNKTPLQDLQISKHNYTYKYLPQDEEVRMSLALHSTFAI
jgi:hypothetical protein